MTEIKNIEFYLFKLPLNIKLNIKNNFISFREAILIKSYFSDGIVAFGEINPLPYFHRETLEDILKHLPFLKKTIIGVNCGQDCSIFSRDDLKPLGDILDLLKANKYLEKMIESLPSMAFGIESMFFAYYILKDFKAKQQEDAKIKIAKLINDLSCMDEDYFLRIADEGYERIKIKIGRLNPDYETTKLNKITDLILKEKSSIKVRLDANNLWDVHATADFCKNINPACIDYIEDPAGSLMQFEDFFYKCRIFTAADELLGMIDSFNEIERELVKTNFKESRFLKALILKPGFLGGFLKTKHFIDKAKLNNIVPVVSHCFESNYSLRLNFIFAYISKISEHITGLNSEDFFLENLLNNTIAASKSSVMLSRVFAGLCSINEKYLTKLNI